MTTKKAIKKSNRQLQCKRVALQRLRPSRAHATTVVRRYIGRQTVPSPRRQMSVETAPLAEAPVRGRAGATTKARVSALTTLGLAGRWATRKFARGMTNLPDKAEPQVNKSKLTAPSNLPPKWPKRTNAYDVGVTSTQPSGRIRWKKLLPVLSRPKWRPKKAHLRRQPLRKTQRGRLRPNPRPPACHQGAASETRVSRDFCCGLQEASAGLVRG